MRKFVFDMYYNLYGKSEWIGQYSAEGESAISAEAKAINAVSLRYCNPHASVSALLWKEII